MSNIKLPFGLNEKSVLVHISDVGSGKKCGCICPSCRSSLIAVRGRIKQHHFRHGTGHECEGGLESAIHLAAKKIIMESMQITLPACVVSISEKDSRGITHTESEGVVENGKVMNFDSVQEEIKIDEIRADLLAIKGDKRLVIEIFYRHKVDDVKKQKIVNANISAIEIDLSDLTSEDVKDWASFGLCINDPKRIEWLHNAKANGGVCRVLESRLRSKIQLIERTYQQEELLQENQRKQEELRKENKRKREQEQLAQAFVELNALRGIEHITRIKQEAATHPVWKHASKYLPFSWHELPDYLNVDVPDGDWIFGCDRRIWQTAFYSYFIDKSGKAFCVKAVDDWLQRVGCKVPLCVKTVGIYSRKYRLRVPSDVSEGLPSSWRTLKEYFGYLCNLGILEFSGGNWKQPGNDWFKVVSPNMRQKIKPATPDGLGKWWKGLDSNQRTLSRADLQSAAINHSATLPRVRR